MLVSLMRMTAYPVPSYRQIFHLVLLRLTIRSLYLIRIKYIMKERGLSMHHEKHENMTISIPQNVKRELYRYVEKRGISRFITEAVIEKLKSKKLSLEEQYRLAAQDEKRNQVFKEWEDVMINEGLNESNDW